MTARHGRFVPLLVSLVLVFGGGWLASVAQTADGRIELREVRFEGERGLGMSGMLYVPAGASAASPAPAVLAVHGYLDSREMQAPYAIELARRGYVVLAMDQPGHGYSDPPSFANRFGGVDGLRYLRSLDLVQRDQIVLTGHSMGGWAVLMAAQQMPDAYRAVVLSGSSTGSYGSPPGSERFPRNLALVYGAYDEFASQMWQTATAAGIVDSPKLRMLFGADTRVEPGRLYGDLAAGTGRKLFMPKQTHAANHITATGVAPVIEWVQATTSAPAPLPADDQIWQWMELGTLLSLAGCILFLFAFGALLLESRPFAALRQAPAAAAGLRGPAWWVGAAAIVLLPMLTYLPLQRWGQSLVRPSAVFPQNVTNGLMVWLLALTATAAVVMLIWHYNAAQPRGAAAASYGLGPDNLSAALRRILGSVLLGGAIVLAAYALCLATDYLFTTDFRWWLVAAKPLDALRGRIFLAYLIPFTLFFVAAGVLLHGQLRSPGSGLGRAAMIRNAALLGGGVALLLLVQYVPLLAGGTLAMHGQLETLLTVVAWQFLLLLPVAGLISTFFFARTGHVYTGAVVNGLFMAWVVVGGQAILYAYRV